MKPFRYYQPQSISETFALLGQYGQGARLLAGGTDLLVRLKSGRFQPDAVIDVKGLPELAGEIRLQGGALRIPALTQMAVLETDPLVRGRFPALAEAAASVGSIQIRNRATLAGNLCNASPAADTAPSLLVYGAHLTLLGPAGARDIPLSAFLTGPGRTALAAGELVSEISLPLPAGAQAAAFAKLTRRKGVDLATVSVCCQVFAAGPARFGVGAAGPAPFTCEDTAGQLLALAGSPERQTEVLQALMAQASPISDVRASQDYRQAMLVVLARRAFETALQRLPAR